MQNIFLFAPAQYFKFEHYDIIKLRVIILFKAVQCSTVHNFTWCYTYWKTWELYVEKGSFKVRPCISFRTIYAFGILISEVSACSASRQNQARNYFFSLIFKYENFLEQRFCNFFIILILVLKCSLFMMQLMHKCCNIINIIIQYTVL